MLSFYNKSYPVLLINFSSRILQAVCFLLSYSTGKHVVMKSRYGKIIVGNKRNLVEKFAG